MYKQGQPPHRLELTVSRRNTDVRAIVVLPVEEAHTPTKLQNTKWTKIMFFFENNNKDQVPIVTVIVGLSQL